MHRSLGRPDFGLEPNGSSPRQTAVQRVRPRSARPAPRATSSPPWPGAPEGWGGLGTAERREAMRVLQGKLRELCKFPRTKTTAKKARSSSLWDRSEILDPQNSCFWKFVPPINRPLGTLTFWSHFFSFLGRVCPSHPSTRSKEESYTPFASFSFDGVLGLALDGMAQAGSLEAARRGFSTEDRLMDGLAGTRDRPV